MEEICKLTPKGMFIFALLDAGLIDDICDNKVKNAWKFFTDKLFKNNYGITEIANNNQGIKQDKL